MGLEALGGGGKGDGAPPQSKDRNVRPKEWGGTDRRAEEVGNTLTRDGVSGQTLRDHQRQRTNLGLAM